MATTTDCCPPIVAPLESAISRNFTIFAQYGSDVDTAQNTDPLTQTAIFNLLNNVHPSQRYEAGLYFNFASYYFMDTAPDFQTFNIITPIYNAYVSKANNNLSLVKVLSSLFAGALMYHQQYGVTAVESIAAMKVTLLAASALVGNPPVLIQTLVQYDAWLPANDW
jgi:hypothetical protein